jgi:hypothetical protein
MLAMQWKHAKLGRKIQTDVLDFLKLHGSVITDRHISGGFITAPAMDINEAVVATVETIIRDLNAEVKKKMSAPQPRQQQQDPDDYSIPGPADKMPDEFPEPQISGKTGAVVKKALESPGPGQVKERFGDFEMLGAQTGGDQDFSYIPPSPAGQRPTKMPDDD